MLGMSRMIKTWKLVSTAGRIPRCGMSYGNKANWCVAWQGPMDRLSPVKGGCGGNWLRRISTVYHRCIPLGTELDDTFRNITVQSI